jgi:hypothetical protein
MKSLNDIKFHLSSQTFQYILIPLLTLFYSRILLVYNGMPRNPRHQRIWHRSSFLRPLSALSSSA